MRNTSLLRDPRLQVIVRTAASAAWRCRGNPEVLLSRGSVAATTPRRHVHQSPSASPTTADDATLRQALSQAKGNVERMQRDCESWRAEEDLMRGIGGGESTNVSSAAQARAVETGAECNDMVTTDHQGGGSGAHSHNDNNNGDVEWVEPTLEDLDRSIPQVDCAFIANLIRSRNVRRSDFLSRKAEVKQRVEALTQQSAGAIGEAARLPRVGGLGFWRSGGGVDEEAGLVATSAEAPVVASAEALTQLSEEEKDLLHTTRPEYEDGFILIDCRTVNEVTSWGIIEGAKVLPAHELFEAFHATPDDFQVEYGFPKPRPTDTIICYCQFGPRSLMAAQILSWMGYLKVLHFRDGYYEWSKQYNLLLRRWMEHDKTSGNELRRLATFQAGLEMQREIAPEFNSLTMGEVSKYHIDSTRSPGKLLVGEGVRLEAYTAVAQLVEGMAPTEIAGVLDESATSGGLITGENHLTRFLEQATGINPLSEEAQHPTTMGLGAAQSKVLDALGANEHADELRPYR